SLILSMPSRTRAQAQSPKPSARQIIVPGEDRFFPFGTTIREGQTVEWVNMDTDDHTVVTNNFYNTAGHNGVDVVIKGTDSNGGQPGKFRLTFHHAGTYVYYCRFHSHLDDAHQSVAPGPNGGIQDANGNFGTPMSGIITVLPDKEDMD